MSRNNLVSVILLIAAALLAVALFIAGAVWRGRMTQGQATSELVLSGKVIVRVEANMERRNFCKTLPGIAVGIGGLVGANLSPLLAQVTGPDSTQVAEIYQLQAAFHLAKSIPDINLLMSLWDPDGSLTIRGNPNSPFVGLDSIRAFTLTTGSFTHHRFSLVPSFKIQIDVHGNEAFFYEECHDVQNFDQPNPVRFIASDTYLAGTVRRIGGKWLFSNMFGGSASPLSVNHYYFP